MKEIVILLMTLIAIGVGIIVFAALHEEIDMNRNSNIPLEEVRCKSIEPTGSFGAGRYYIFTLDGHRHLVTQHTWDKYDVPTCP